MSAFTKSLGTGHRRGRLPGQLPSKPIVWDLKMAARSYCQEALDYIVGVMRDSNSPQPNRLKAAEILLERGYGKPHVSVEVNTEHKFVVAPNTMDQETWLARRGQPVGDDSWLIEQGVLRKMRADWDTVRAMLTDPKTPRRDAQGRDVSRFGPIWSWRARRPSMRALRGFRLRCVTVTPGPPQPRTHHGLPRPVLYR
jgi:hypothetical protein